MEEKEKSNNALREEKVLEFWQGSKIFEKSLEKDSPKGEYVFFEGPPTANGRPGIHHLEARAFKDAVLRYKTMNGFLVKRKGGWDTHGLPVEIEVEKKLNLESKKEIEEYGIDKFNKECKKCVWTYTDLWYKFTNRIGFWVDQENPYVTYHNSFIESVWNVIKEADKQKLLYRDYKIVPWCPRCGTGLSSHELAQGYQDVKDITVYVKFKLTGVSCSQFFSRITPEVLCDTEKTENTSLSILVWTTTPWTLPSNVALAVGEDIEYVLIKQNEEFLILAKSRLCILEGNFEIIKEIKGSDLLGLSYEPLYPYTKNIISKEESEKLINAYKIHNASFVTTEDGTGVVHIAPMYGQDDFDLGNNVGLPKCHLVGLDGKFLEGTDFLNNRFVRDEDVAIDIIKDLAGKNLLYKKEKYEHTYPHCWRCKTALIYYARDSWYIKMSALRDKMVKENENINWEPSYIKEGRFGEWLKDIKDWAISRERYWGTPLPAWTCNECKKIHVLGSVSDIKNKSPKSGNQYFFMRHGESENNVLDTISCSLDSVYGLTEKGVEQIKQSSESLKDKNIDLIFSSPLKRTKETANIVASVLGKKEEEIVFDERLREMMILSRDGETWTKYHEDFPNNEENFDHHEEGDESFYMLKKRVMDFLDDIESKYKNKNILIVTHGGLAWLAGVGSLGLEIKDIVSKIGKDEFFKNGEVRKVDYIRFPHNENYELDLHRPYVDNINLVCGDIKDDGKICEGKLERTKEVMDVWLDSGSMPFAQSHYPFSTKDISYPADFISEGIDQTRGWFYTLHAVGNIMGKGMAFKNVICLGLVLDANGKKMSKSLGNGVDPWVMIDKYGVDTLRLWMYSVNQPGEPKNFDEKTVSELNNKFFNLLYNVWAFYELYRDEKFELQEVPESKNVLDKWILSKLFVLSEDVTQSMESYKLLEPVRSIKSFIDDLSTWYLRRSRDRIKEGDIEAKQTLYFVFKTLSKMIAPFAPFAAEDLWLKTRKETDQESVHLVSWPSLKISEIYFGKCQAEEVLNNMKETREVVTLGLQARQKAGIAVRQPLASVLVKKHNLKDEYVSILKDELNVKDVFFEDSSELEVVLDTNITEELKKEGNFRELVRAIQDIRKQKGLNPSDQVNLEIFSTEDGYNFVDGFKDLLMKNVGAISLAKKENEGSPVRIDGFDFIVNISK